jgi:hypothetical protein
MAYAIKNSTTIILPRWRVLLDELELKSRMMPRDVTTRWNSTYDMLEFALAFREPLDAITSEKEMKLRKFEMDNDEWEIASQLCEVLKVSLSLAIVPFLIILIHLQVFKDATLFFSRDGTPNLATVIPAMDCIEEVLTTNAVDQKLSLSIRAALAIGKRTLNRYYCKTALSDVYRIAMGMYFYDYLAEAF